MTADGTAAYWDGVAAGWAGADRDVAWRRHGDRVNAALVEVAVPPGPLDVLKTDVFDEAVGEGVFPLLARRGARVTGVDVSPRLVRQAAARAPGLDCRVGDTRALPFDDGSFDVVLSLSTLDHFERLDDVERSLAELHRVLRPGGRLVLTLDNGANLAVALRNRAPGLLRRLGVVPYRVGVTCRSAGELERLVLRAGFRGVVAGEALYAPRALAAAIGRLVDRSGSTRLRDAFGTTLWAVERLCRGRRRRHGYYLTVCARRP